MIVSKLNKCTDWNLLSIIISFLQINEVNGELKNSECAPAIRQKRDAEKMIVGGNRPLDVNDADVKLFLDEALVKINAGEDPDYR